MDTKDGHLVVVAHRAETQEASWAHHYERLVAAGAPPWLDLSNEAVHAQTVAVALESAGSVLGRRALDLGCGTGRLASALHGMGSSEVVAVDQNPATILACRERHPTVRWVCGSASDGPLVASLGRFDLVFVIEVLQYVAWPRVLSDVWMALNPGGRIVGVVPNPEDPIVQRTMARYAEYLPPRSSELARLARSLPGLDWFAVRSMQFQADQRVAPYRSTDWGLGSGSVEGNRLNFVYRKRPDPTQP